MRSWLIGSLFLLVAIFSLPRCNGCSSANDGDTTVGADVDTIAPGDAADGTGGDLGKDSSVPDVADVVPDAPVPETGETADTADAVDAADAADVAPDATPDAADAAPEATVDPMDELFEGIGDECRPADLGCTTDDACAAAEACVAGACQAVTAPADYAVDVVRVLSVVRLPPAGSGSGFDLNGDGVPDNRVADTLGLTPGRTDKVNDTFAKYIDSGAFTYLAAFRDVPADGCGPLSVAILPATGDLDLDGVPDQSGQYQMLATGFRDDGYGPLAQMNVAAMDQALVLTGPGASLDFKVPLGDGTVLDVPLEGVRMRADLDLLAPSPATLQRGMLPLSATDPLNAELGGYIRLASVVQSLNQRAAGCTCAGVGADTPLAEMGVEGGQLKAHCVQAFDDSECSEATDGKVCANVTSTCAVLMVMSGLLDVASGQTTDEAGEVIKDAISLSLYVTLTPATLAEPPLAPDFAAVPDSWRVLPEYDLVTQWPAKLGVLLNDFVDESATPLITAVTQGTHGGAVAIGDDTRYVVYTPVPGAWGFDDFTYTLRDASGNTSTAAVQVRLSTTGTLDCTADAASYCEQYCRHEAVCQPDDFAYALDGLDACIADCVVTLGVQLDVPSACGQANRCLEMCRIDLPCNRTADYEAAVAAVQAGENGVDVKPCGYWIETRLDACEDLVCPPGTWGLECQACAVGTYCAGGGTFPKPCQAGTADADLDPATPCAACEVGTYCAGGAAPAEDCPAGTADADLDPTTPCAACDVGTYCAGGAAPAEPCPAGFTDADLDPATPCADVDECAAGGPGAQACAPGTCTNAPGGYACTCPAGYGGTGGTACELRPTGLDCQDIFEKGDSAGDGLYLIDPDGDGQQAAFEVYCDMTGGGWTQLFDQDVNVGTGYLPAATWLAGVTTTPPNGGQFSALQHLSILSGYSMSFMLRLTWGQAEDSRLEWRQWGDPTWGSASSCSGRLMNPLGQTGYSSDFWGLTRNMVNDEAAFVGESGGAFAVGTSAPYQGGLKAYADSAAGELVTDRTRLYFRRQRVDPIDCNDLSGTNGYTAGVYRIDPDGYEGPVSGFDVYCPQDGYGWTEIADQDASLGTWPGPDAYLAGLTATAPDGGSWSVLQHLAAFADWKGRYTFRLAWGPSNETGVEWQQTSNPLEGRGTVSNVVMTPTDQVGLGVGGPFSGLAHDDGAAALDGEPGTAFGWAIGTQASYGDGLPTYADQSSSRARLYFRRD